MQYIGPSLSYHLSLRSLFGLFLRGGFTQVLLYFNIKIISFIVTYIENYAISFGHDHLQKVGFLIKGFTFFCHTYFLGKI